MILCLAVASHCYPERVLDYRVTSVQDTLKECPREGPYCESCTSLVICIYDEDNENYTKTGGGSCPSSYNCLNRKTANGITTGQCLNETDPICDHVDQVPFPCTSAGIFPDPFYFNKYVMCVSISSSLQPYSATCPSGYGFDVKSDLCSCKLNVDGLCGEDLFPIPVCQTVGEAYAVKGKPAMYYICETKTISSKAVLYPVLYVCEGGETYSNYECSEPNSGESTTTETTSSTIPHSTPTDSGESTTQSTRDIPF